MHFSVDVDVNVGFVVDVVFLETARCHVMTFIPTPREMRETSMRKSSCKISSAFEWKANYDNSGLCARKNTAVSTSLSQEAPMALAYNTYKLILQDGILHMNDFYLKDESSNNCDYKFISANAVLDSTTQKKGLIR